MKLKSLSLFFIQLFDDCPVRAQYFFSDLPGGSRGGGVGDARPVSRTFRLRFLHPMANGRACKRPTSRWQASLIHDAEQF